MLPGMTGRASIVIETNEDSMLVPFTAVLKLEETAYVYVVADDEQGTPRAHRVEVELGVDLGDWVEVTSGIAPTDNVIYTGRELVDEGTEVRISENPPSIAAPTDDESVGMDKQPPGHEAQVAQDAAEAQAKADKAKKRRGKKRAAEGDTDADTPAGDDDADTSTDDADTATDDEKPTANAKDKARAKKTSAGRRGKAKSDTPPGASRSPSADDAAPSPAAPAGTSPQP